MINSRNLIYTNNLDLTRDFRLEIIKPNVFGPLVLDVFGGLLAAAR